MTKVTVGTFNTYNLFTRYKFNGRKRRFPAPEGSGKKFTYKWVKYTKDELFEAVKNGFSFHSNVFKKLSQEDRNLTAIVISELDADILAVQEVESLDTLKMFNSEHLTGNSKFRYKYLISGNDPRGIDLGVLSKHKADFLRTHQFDRNKAGTWWQFSRDCLEVHYEIDGIPLVVFSNHLKSMFSTDPGDGRANTRERRLEQSHAIIEKLVATFGSNYERENFVILGDFNDYVDPGEEGLSGITPLTTNPSMHDVLTRLPAEDRWTYFYKKDQSYNQLDYIFISKRLANVNPDALPKIVRAGMPMTVNQPGKPARVDNFFQGITKNKKASDHAGVSITLNL